MKETPKQKYKMNFKGKFTAQNTPDVTADEVLGELEDKYWSGYERILLLDTDKFIGIRFNENRHREIQSLLLSIKSERNC